MSLELDYWQRQASDSEIGEEKSLSESRSATGKSILTVLDAHHYELSGFTVPHDKLPGWAYFYIPLLINRSVLLNYSVTNNEINFLSRCNSPYGYRGIVNDLITDLNGPKSDFIFEPFSDPVFSGLLLSRIRDIKPWHELMKLNVSMERSINGFREDFHEQSGFYIYPKDVDIQLLSQKVVQRIY